MAVQALFVASSLAGLAAGDAAAIRDSITPPPRARTRPASRSARSWSCGSTLGPILLGAGIPALLMGLGFPLANAIVQRAEYSVGRRAGVLYLSNTAGAVCGSLMTGFLLLPALGIQGSATVAVRPRRHLPWCLWLWRRTPRRHAGAGGVAAHRDRPPWRPGSCCRRITSSRERWSCRRCRRRVLIAERRASPK